MLQRSLLRTSRIALANKPLASSSCSAIRSHVVRPAPIRLPLPSARASRWYSAETTQEGKTNGSEGKQEEASKTEQSAAQPSEAEQLKKELEAKNKEVVDLKDKYLRSVADFRNLQERTKRETAQARDFAITRFARDLIDSVDNLDRALTSVPSTASESKDTAKDLENLHSGLKMTDTILMQTLKKHGLERFDPSEKGDKFDPNVHEAVFQVPQPEKEDGAVIHTQQKGFMLNGRVIRAAKVGVVKNS